MMATAEKVAMTLALALIAALAVSAHLPSEPADTAVDEGPAVPYYYCDSLEALNWRRFTYIDSVFNHRTDTVIIPYRSLFEKHADSLGWNWRLVASVAFAESGFDFRARSGCGAQGLMQVMGNTARLYGAEDALDPSENIRVGVTCLNDISRKLYKYSPNRDDRMQLVLAAYNAGPVRISRCLDSLASGGVKAKNWHEFIQAVPSVDDFNWTETDSFVRKVQHVYSHFRSIK